MRTEGPLSWNPFTDKAWARTYGGAQLDWGWSAQQTADGGYVLAGETVSYGAGHYDAWLIKTDAYGNEAWNRTFGGIHKDGIRSVQQTADGGFILAGYTDSYGYPGHDVWLIKTDGNGNPVWDSIFGGPDTDAGYAVRQIPDGGYIVTGYVTSFGAGSYDIWLIKTDADGEEIWNRTLGGEGAEYGMCVSPAADGGFIVTGSTTSFGAGGTDLWLIKTDADGNEEWNRTFGGTDDDWGGSVWPTEDGGYIVTGDTHSFGPGGFDIWLIKTDSGGHEVWRRIFGEAGSDDTGYGVRQTCDGGYAVTGTQTNLDTGDTDAWLIETDPDGYILRDMIYGGGNGDWAYTVHQTFDGGFAVAGCTDSFGAGSRDAWLIRVDAEDPNRPPGTPGILGPAKGLIGRSYEYTFHAIDPDGGHLYFFIDWGDGTSGEWTVSCDSGEACRTAHRWHKAGLYQVRAKARDGCGFEGGWSAPRTVRISFGASDFMVSPLDAPDFKGETTSKEMDVF
jgi:hypothetical protein